MSSQIPVPTVVAIEGSPRDKKETSMTTMNFIAHGINGSMIEMGSSRKILLTFCDQSGMTRSELSMWLGVHERTLYRWLAGETPIPVAVMRAIRTLENPNVILKSA